MRGPVTVELSHYECSVGSSRSRSYTRPTMAKIAIVLIVMIAIAGVVAVVISSTGHGSHRAETRRILDSLPLYPESQIIGETSIEYDDYDETLTSRSYSIPGGGRVCLRMVDWYGHVLSDRPGWGVVGGNEYDVSWERGKEIVELICSGTAEGRPGLSIHAAYIGNPKG
jgi:hypothetical protein